MELREFQQLLFKDMRLILLMILGLLTVLKLIDVLIYAGVIAYLFFPLHKKLVKKIWPSVSAALITFLALVILIFPIILLVRFFISNYERIFFVIKSSVDAFRTNFVQFDVIFGSNITNLVLNKISVYLYNAISNSAHLLIKTFLFAFLLFYFLKDHDRINKYITSLFEKVWKEGDILKKIEEFVYSLLYGYFFTAALISVLGGVFFWLLGYDYAILLAFILALTVLIPVIGAWTICVPLAIYEIYSKQNYLLALSLIVIAIFLDSLKLYLISKTSGAKARVHPAIVMVGILGGLYFFGPVGIFVGPVSLGLLKILISSRFEL